MSARRDEITQKLGEGTARRLRPPHPGPGSFRTLEVLARLGVAGVEPLAYIVGNSKRTTYDHLRRLERAGLAARVRRRDGGGGMVAITRKGARWVRDDDLPAVLPPANVPVVGVHSRAVSWVAAYFEQTWDGGYWFGPAELRQEDGWRLERDDGAGHFPDLGFVSPRGDRVAIEVELHSKSNTRLRSILSGYSAMIAMDRLLYVGYVTTRPPVARAVRRQAEAVLLLGKRIRFVEFDAVVESVRKRAARP